MSKFFHSVHAEHKKLWGKRTFPLSFLAVFVLAFVLTSTGGQLSGWSGSYPAVPVNKILTDVMYRSSTTVSDGDLPGYYTAAANKAAERLVEINANIEFTTGRQRYALEREKAQLLYDGGIARYRVQYGLFGSDSFSGQLVIFCLWLLTPLIALFSVFYASDMFAGEFNRGTVRMMLCRPVTRIRQYFAKLFTALLYSLALAGGAMAVSFGLAYMNYGGRLERTYIGLLNGSVYMTSWQTHLWAAAVCCLASVETCVLMCAFLGNLTHSRAVSITVPVAVLFIGLCLGPWIGAASSAIPGLTLFCCIDLASPLCGTGCSPYLEFSEYAASLGLHMVMFLIGGYAAFRRDVS